jgi:hypothetical protein
MQRRKSNNEKSITFLQMALFGIIKRYVMSGGILFQKNVLIKHQLVYSNKHIATKDVIQSNVENLFV